MDSPDIPNIDLSSIKKQSNSNPTVEDKTKAMQEAWELMKASKKNSKESDISTYSQNKERVFEALSRLYDELLLSCSVRTNNVLYTFQQNFPNKWTFLNRLVKMSRNELFSLRNAGSKTVDEIFYVSQTLLSNLKSEDLYIPKESWKLPDNIDELLPLFLSTTEGLSGRAKKRILWLLDRCGNSLDSFYKHITIPGFVKSMPQMGVKTMQEVTDFFESSIAFLKRFPNEESVNDRIKYSALGFSEETISFFIRKEISLGHFPIFAAIHTYLEHLTTEEKSLIRDCLLIYKEQVLPKRTEVSSSHKLSSERIRQKRNDLLNKLSSHFKIYQNLGFVNQNPYIFQMTNLEDDVNSSEGTHFNLNFISWVLGCVFDELTIIGDPIKSLGGYYRSDYYLCLVPTQLIRLFDFEAFIEDMNNRLKEKRYDEEMLSIKNLISNHTRSAQSEDEIQEIETTCRTILFQRFPVKFSDDFIILPANIYKLNRTIIKEILCSAGHQMTLSEITNEFQRLHPDRDINEGKVRSAIGGDKGILPIGRSSTYILSEWENDRLKGGTIRSLVQEFIDSTPEKIATTASIAEYVQRFRPGTNESNIVYNLCFDPSKTFILYYKEGVRYFGYANRFYLIDYFPLESNGTTAKINSINYPRLLYYIKTHKTLPISTGLAEERRLYQFWRKQTIKYKNKSLDHHALVFYNLINKKIGDLKLPHF